MSSSNDESGKSSEGGGDTVDKHMEPSDLEKLKRLKKYFNLTFEKHRDIVINHWGYLIKDWKEQLPNLQDIFTKQEMDLLLVSSLKSSWCLKIVEFVARSGYRDKPELDENGKPLLCCTTAIHEIVECRNIYIRGFYFRVLEKLFEIYDKFHVNYTNESGVSHFHVACGFYCYDIVENFLEHGQDPDYLAPKSSVGPPLLYVVANCFKIKDTKKIIRVLLENGANPNLTNKEGSTPIHIICKRLYHSTFNDDYDKWIETIFEVSEENNQVVKVNAWDKWGDTPLDLALKAGHMMVVESLLRRGADPNSANAEGLTPLHKMAKTGDLLAMQLFFEINKDMQQTVQIDPQDNLGNRPLHLALREGNDEVAEWLLRIGAHPIVANAEGLTPLHLIARIDIQGDMMELFFRINKKKQQTVGIDARDNLGRTPLEWAVASCNPLAVKTLLIHGANVSGFVFPTASDSDRFEDIDRTLCRRFSEDRYEDYVNSPSLTKLTAATGLLAIAELLEKRGYELDRDDALKVMGFFDKYGLYESTDSSTSKEVDDLVDSLFEEMAKNPTYMDDYKFASSYKLRKLPPMSMEVCSLHLCEKVSRKFFRDWALDPFMELIHYRLPILCCEMIIDNLLNEDLFRICLAAAGLDDDNTSDSRESDSLIRGYKNKFWKNESRK